MIAELYKAFLNSSGVCTDTRKIAANNIFFALKGPLFNGNDFVISALNEGCAYAVADEDRPEFKGRDDVFVSSDALTSLQQLANHHRNKLKIPIVALTGSNGKTTTKELVREALSTQYNCLATKGNLNNHIGVPLTLLEINKKTEIAIIEMGANHQKEIAALCAIAEPTYGLITNIGLAHLEGFGGVEGIYLGKKELFDYLIETDGTLFINQDDSKILSAAGASSGISYGASEESIYCGKASLVSGMLQVQWKRSDQDNLQNINTSLSGLYNFSNVMAAVAVARYFGVAAKKICQSIEAYRPENNRSQVVQSKAGNKVIIDCYNANPSSMSAALINLSETDNKDSVAILGDMMELGETAKSAHQDIIDQCQELNIRKVLLVGALFASTNYPEHYELFNNVDDARAHLVSKPIQSATVLLKGSRSMTLEKLIDVV